MLLKIEENSFVVRNYYYEIQDFIILVIFGGAFAGFGRPDNPGKRY